MWMYRDAPEKIIYTRFFCEIIFSCYNNQIWNNRYYDVTMCHKLIWNTFIIIYNFLIIIIKLFSCFDGYYLLVQSSFISKNIFKSKSLCKVVNNSLSISSDTTYVILFLIIHYLAATNIFNLLYITLKYICISNNIIFPCIKK